jgi:hypothetical protein
MVAGAAFPAGCSAGPQGTSSTPVDRDAVVHFAVTGGLIAQDRSLSVSSDGRARLIDRRTESETTFAVPSEARGPLRAAVAAAVAAGGSASSTTADARHYEIQSESQTVSFDDGSVPADASDALRQLTALTDWGPLLVSRGGLDADRQLTVLRTGEATAFLRGSPTRRVTLSSRRLASLRATLDAAAYERADLARFDLGQGAMAVTHKFRRLDPTRRPKQARQVVVALKQLYREIRG